MARMHSRDRGKSGSKKPIDKTTPKWVTYKPKEAEMLVVKLAKEGNSSSVIGTILRDTYGIPSVKSLTGKTVVAIMREKDAYKGLPEDLANLIRKMIALTKHIEDNGQDRTSKRGLTLTISKINRLIKYYKKSGVLEPDWKFNRSQASFYVE